MLTESYFSPTWSSNTSGIDDDDWLIKTAFKPSSGCQNRARMNLGLALDRASPNKENVTYSDSDLFLEGALQATYNSPIKFNGANHLASSHPRQPLDDQDPNSQDSGYCPSDDNKPVFRFVEPYASVPRKNSIEPSPRKDMTSPLTKSALLSPNAIGMFSRSMSSGAESTDDGFLDSIVNDKSDEETNLPSNMSSLLSGSIRRDVVPSSPDSPMTFEVNSRDEFARPPLRRCQSTIENTSNTPLRRVRTSLFRQSAVVRTLESTLEGSPVTQLANSALTSLCLSSSSTTVTSTVNTFKRPEPPGKGSPILKKRRRSLLHISENEKSPPSPSRALLQCHFEEKTTVKLQRSMSASEATIMSALSRASQDPQLIGDFSKPCALPLTEGRIQDLKNISCDTLANLIKGEYESQIANYTIVDCRYPYEYEGGHIVGARNIFTREQIHEEFVKSKTNLENDSPADCSKRNILIFHCEFSSERGPNLSRFLRNLDRDGNNYPALNYPEMYLLQGGYKQFYEKHKELCTPMEYRPMAHPDHESDLRKFRAKSKSWNGGDGKSRIAPRGSLKRLGL